jgi:dihydrofolate reductase
MRLTSITHVTLDGVAADSVFGRADAFLFGRKTYDIFAGYWGVMDPSENAIAEALNTKPKYVVEHAHRARVGRHDGALR